MSVDIQIVGAEDLNRMLARFQGAELKKRASRATKAGAKVLEVPLKLAVEPLSKRMAGSVWVHAAKREKPGYIVGHHRKKAFFWHMVIGGTQDHSTAARDGHRAGPFVRGVKPHPVVGEVADRYANVALAAVADDLMKDV